MKSACRGITLVELLVCMVVLAIIGGIDVLILSSGLDSWAHVQRRLALQQVSDETMRILLEGGFDEQGMRDAVELKEARTEEIAFVPLWTDRSHKPNKVQNREQKFILEKQFKSGSAIPVAQVRPSDKEDWQNVPIRFEEGSGAEENKPDDVVTFSKPIPIGSNLRIIYTPDAAVHPETMMRFKFDPQTKQITRSYAGKTEVIPKRLQGVQVEQLAFLYFDNLNHLLPLHKEYDYAERRRITGVKIYMATSRSQERRESTSFTNIRNVQTVGITISEGSIVPIPGPKVIKAFSVGDLSGLTRDGIIEMAVGSQGRLRWKIRLEFKPTDNPQRVILERFEIQAPPGQPRTSGILHQTISRNEFVDLMGIDRTGLFAYNNDPNVDRVVVVPEGDNFLEVTRCDFEVASLFIRP